MRQNITGGRNIVTGRHYKIDGERFPSVTTVLTILEKSGLAKWRGNVGNTEADRISKEAADYGTAIHALVEQINLGNRGPFGEPDDTVVKAYIDWYDEHVSTVLGAERLCVSRQFKYAGTADGVVVLNDDKDATIIDLKTSKTDLGQREWALQLAAYALALEEEGITCRRRIILRMPKKTPGALHVLEIPDADLERDQRAFLNVLKIWRWHESKELVKAPPGPRIRFGGRP
jgi:hypothetical protein